MPQFIKLTRVTDWKFEGDTAETKKRVATGTQAVYIRPSEITQFADDGDYTCVTLGDSSITVTEKANEIYKMISDRAEDRHYYIPSLHENWNGKWWDTDWWKNTPIYCNGASVENFTKNLPYYSATIIYSNGDFWE